MKPGPRTPEGKARSSQNALTHGCRSQTVILPGESQDDFDDLYDRWMHAYQPETAATIELVEQLILAKWFLARIERRYSELEQSLASCSFVTWSADQHKQFQLAMRYKTAAERSVSTALRQLEDFLNNRRKEDIHAQRVTTQAQNAVLDFVQNTRKVEDSLQDRIAQAAALGIDVTRENNGLATLKKKNRDTVKTMQQNLATARDKSRAQILFQSQRSPKKLRRTPVLDQWVEIKVKDGVTLTNLHPSNDNLILRGQAMDPPPELVYRRLHFLGGVPKEYEWTGPTEQARRYGGLAIQRITTDTWLELIEKEKLDPAGLLLPSGSRNMPRPVDRGGCDCPCCTDASERLKQEAEERQAQIFVSQQDQARRDLPEFTSLDLSGSILLDFDDSNDHDPVPGEPAA